MFFSKELKDFNPKESILNAEIEKWLAQPAGWFIYNTHGLDEEGWGPLNTDFLN